MITRRFQILDNGLGCCYIDVRTGPRVSAAQAKQNAIEKWWKEFPSHGIVRVAEIPVSQTKPHFSIGPSK